MLKEIGIVKLGMGIESMNPRILKVMKRNVVKNKMIIANLISRVRNKITFIKIVSYYYLWYPILAEKTDEILKYDEEAIGVNPDEQLEWALPGFSKYLNTGYYKYMLGRYLYSLRYIKDKIVLDSACGFDWGSYLISGYPKMFISVDIDSEALDFARNTWKAEGLKFIRHSVLELESLNERYDVVLGYEIIEHLKFSEGKKYLEGACNILNKNGKLILSSYFPCTERNARKAEKQNKYHSHIYTQKEMRELLKLAGFSGNIMIIARK